MKAKAMMTAAALCALCHFQAGFAQNEDYFIYIKNFTDAKVIFSLKPGESSWVEFDLKGREQSRWEFSGLASQDSIYFKMLTNQGEVLYRLGREEDDLYNRYVIIRRGSGAGHFDLLQERVFFNFNKRRAKSAGESASDKSRP